MKMNTKIEDKIVAILKKFTVFNTNEEVAKELSTLIQEERKSAVREYERFCRDMDDLDLDNDELLRRYLSQLTKKGQTNE